MAERIQKQKPEPQKRQETEAPQPKAQDTTELLDEVTDFLDEVDALLDEVVGEGTAEEFVTGFKQRGGQ